LTSLSIRIGSIRTAHTFSFIESKVFLASQAFGVIALIAVCCGTALKEFKRKMKISNLITLTSFSIRIGSTRTGIDAASFIFEKAWFTSYAF